MTFISRNLLYHPRHIASLCRRWHIRVDAWVVDHQKITPEDELDVPVRQTFTGIFRSGAVCDAFVP